MAENCYEILGVSNDATQETIQKAYWKLAKQYHPDMNQGTEEQFKRVCAAYKIIGDVEKRKLYDNPVDISFVFDIIDSLNSLLEGIF